jgi:hypothetical protein
MGKNGPDMNSFAIKVNHNDKSVLVPANIKDDKPADLVDCSKCLLELGEILKILGATDRKPGS